MSKVLNLILLPHLTPSPSVTLQSTLWSPSVSWELSSPRPLSKHSRGCTSAAAKEIQSDIDNDGALLHHHLACYWHSQGHGRRLHSQRKTLHYINTQLLFLFSIFWSTSFQLISRTFLIFCICTLPGEYFLHIVYFNCSAFFILEHIVYIYTIQLYIKTYLAIHPFLIDYFLLLYDSNIVVY